MNAIVKRILIVLGIVVLVIALILGGYVAYVMLTYNRISDHQAIEVENDQAGAIVAAGKEYTATTYNIGFGAYTPEFTFFMDEGIMADGTPTVGTQSVAASEESVRACTEGAIEAIASLEPDFALFQEVDTDSTRSYGMNQRAAIEEAFPDKGAAFAVNFHSAFLAVPPTQPHGFANSGLLSLTGSHVNEAERRSYPVDQSFPTKFFDLDRCFLVERLPVDNGKELVLVNSHLSAYDEGGKIRAQQFAMLSDALEEEVSAGNYVVLGGDWNHALCESQDIYPSDQLIPPWLATFDDSMLPAGFSVVRPDNLEEVATCRGTDIPYEKGHTYTVTIDGFIVSSNVKARTSNVDTEFAYSDHNPVVLTFSLEP